ncbi:MAG: hypothetical protein NVS9B12_02850 [Vulcanimicrobiaceae bacterium]
MTTIALVLTIVAGAGFLLIGIAAMAQPAILSHLYGLYVHETNGRGFVRAAGARDAAFGALLLIFAYRVPEAIVVTLLAGLFLAISDFLTVWRTNGRFELTFLAGHIAGAVLLGCTATIVGMSNLSR